MKLYLHQGTKLNPNATEFWVLLSGKEYFQRADTLKEAYEYAEEADKMFPEEAVWIATPEMYRSPESALAAFDA